MPNQLTFADADWVTGGHPTVDGFTGLHDMYLDGVNTAENDEPGYDLGGRITFDGGGGLSPAVIQGVKGAGENYLYLSLLIRQDQAFDNNDLVIVSIRPQFGGTHDDSTFRFDIFPVWTAETAGADSQSAGDPNLPAGTADDTVLGRPGIPTPPSTYHIRSKRPPRAVDVYRGRTGGPPYWENPTNALPEGMEIRVRSWTPLTASGAAPDCCWSIEVKLPMSIPTGVESSVNLEAMFGLYVNLVRVAAGGSPPVFNYQANTQYVWPDPSATVTGNLGVNTPIDPTKYGQGYIPSIDSPVGANTALGVKFRYDAWGNPLVGARAATAPANSAPGVTVHAPPSTIDNVLVAQIENTGPNPADDAANVTADFHFANWGLGPGPGATTNPFPNWAPASGAAPIPTNPQNVPHGSQVELTSNWPVANVPTDYVGHEHQCVFVMLDSQSGVDFVQDSVRRNMDIVNYSEQRRAAEISGKGYPSPNSGTKHRFALVVNSRQVWLPDPRAGGGADGGGDGPIERPTIATHAPAPQLVPMWQWIVSGYRRLDESLTINGTEYETWHPEPGAFGLVGTHDDPKHVLSYDLSGPGLKQLANGVFELEVEHNGTVTLDTVVSVGPERPGCLGILWQIIEAIRRLFK